MHSKIAAACFLGVSCLSTVASAAPFTFPTSDGFPFTDNVADIEALAQGTLPIAPVAPANAPAAAPPSLATKRLLALLATNELAEVAFYTEFIANITSNTNGFNTWVDSFEKDIVLDNLGAILATEKLHETKVNGALGDSKIVPCKYNFPVSTFDEAIAFAATFTDVSLGVLPAIQQRVAVNGDGGLIPGLGGVIGNEAEQEGLYHIMEGKLAANLPFLTAGTPIWLLSILLDNVIAGQDSCDAGNLTFTGFPILPPLTVVSTPGAAAGPVQFSVALTSNITSYGPNYASALALTYVNQQNAPTTVAISGTSVSNNVLSFTANFPFNNPTFGNGLTYAALTTGGLTPNFANPDAVANATIAGPGLIEV